MSKKNYILTLFLAAGLAVSGCGFQPTAENSQPADEGTQPEQLAPVTPDAEELAEPEPIVEEESGATSAVQEFNLTAANFNYDVTEIRVTKGQTVRLNLRVEQGFHDWVIDEFNAAIRQLQAGESDSVEFVADQAGSFEFYCSVGSHRQMGMVGRLIVE